MIYSHLSRDNRVVFAALWREGFSVSSIAGRIGCHRGTLYREGQEIVLSPVMATARKPIGGR